MTGVNLVTEVEQPLTWFLAPVVILVLLVIASSLDKPHPAPLGNGRRGTKGLSHLTVKPFFWKRCVDDVISAVSGK